MSPLHLRIFNSLYNMQFQLPETKDENILINCRMRSTFLAKGLKYKLFIVLFVTCICVCFHNLIQEIICLSLINNAILFLLVSCQFVNINFPCDQIQNAEKLRKIENEMGKKSLSTFWLKFEMEKESLVPSYLFFNQKEIILLHNFKKKKTSAEDSLCRLSSQLCLHHKKHLCYTSEYHR